MGHRDSYNFELALKLEVDPAARRRARRHRDAGPATHPGRTVTVTGTGPLTARASAWVSGKCDLESESGPKAGVPGPGACDCRRGPPAISKPGYYYVTLFFS